MDPIVSPPLRAELERYLAGEASAEEAVLVRRWIDADPRRSVSVQVLKTLDHAAGASPHASVHASVSHASTLSARWDTVKHTILTPAPRPTRHATRPHMPGVARVSLVRISSMRRGLVGGVALAAALGIAYFSGLWGRVTRPSVESVSYATASRERRTLTLPDGSEIVMAPGTHLTYRAGSGGARTVLLEGQARFTVTHDPSRPFQVRSGAVTTRVLGTRFDVRAYPGEAGAQVVVFDGRVASGNARTSVVVSAGMIARVTDSIATIVDANDTTMPAEWVDGRLVFRNTSVRAMLTTLERWYGLQFRVPDSTLAMRRVSAVLLSDQPAQSLNELKDMLDVTLTFDDTVVTVRRRVRAAQSGTQGGAPERSTLPTPIPAEVGK